MKYFILLIVALVFSLAINAQLNISFRSNLQYPGQTCSSVWGYVDSTGREYALLGTQNGVSIVDVTNPDSPFEVKNLPGTEGTYREIKTAGKYAYVTTENVGYITVGSTIQIVGGGIQIIDLSKLPDANAVTYKFWRAKLGLDSLRTSHTLAIYNNYLYLFGSRTTYSDTVVDGVIIASLTDPWNPVIVGISGKDVPYIHDGCIRNDTLYAAHIGSGFFSIIDVTQKNKPVLLQKQDTPRRATHNTALSDNNKVIFTTDENINSRTHLTAFDVSDINNITELDKIVISTEYATIHNTYVKNDYAISSWYAAGLDIVDTHRPNNLVEVGNYDPYLSLTGFGYSGAWGVYPFLPSGNLLVSSYSEGYGLFVLSPTYTRASYLEGMVKDSLTLNPLASVKVEILSTTIVDKTDIAGNYAIGYHTAGLYTVQFSKPGYVSKIINNVNLSTGIVTFLNIKLLALIPFSITVHVEDQSGNSLTANVKMYSSNYNLDATTNSSGNAIVSGIFNDTYEISIGKWNYITQCFSQQVQSTSGTINVILNKGFMDDFTFNYGWVTQQAGWKFGKWKRDIPKSIAAGPNEDEQSDCFANAYITGNLNDVYQDTSVMNSTQTLISPLLDLSAYSNPYINYYYWYNNDTSPNFFSPVPPGLDDTLYVKLTDGTSTVTVSKINISTASLKSWTKQQFKVSDFINPTSNMKFIFIAKENPTYYPVNSGISGDYNSQLMKVGLDNFSVSEGPNGVNEKLVLDNNIKIFPNPATNKLTVVHNSIQKKCMIEIYSGAGALLLKEMMDEFVNDVDVSNFQTGIYFVKITTERQSVYRKFIKH